MLKRLSFGSDAPVSPLPPRSPGNHSTSYPFPTIPPSPNNSSAKHPASNNSDTKSLPIERKALHAFIKSFSSLLLILNEFKDLSNALARCERRLGKGLSEIATLCDEEKRSGTVVGNALNASATLLGDLCDVDGKLGKQAQKEYETINGNALSYFNRVAKEEKINDETIESLDKKIKNASATYDRSRSPASASLTTQAHDRYIMTISKLSATISTTKANHNESMSSLRDGIVKELARVSASLCESLWRNKIEGTKRSGARIGSVAATAVFCEAGMPNYVEDMSASPSSTGGLRGPRPLLPSLQSRSSFDYHQQITSDHSSTLEPPLPSFNRYSTSSSSSSLAGSRAVSPIRPSIGSSVPLSSPRPISMNRSQTLELPTVTSSTPNQIRRKVSDESSGSRGGIYGDEGGDRDKVRRYSDDISPQSTSRPSFAPSPSYTTLPQSKSQSATTLPVAENRSRRNYENDLIAPIASAPAVIAPRGFLIDEHDDPYFDSRSTGDHASGGWKEATRLNMNRDESSSYGLSIVTNNATGGPHHGRNMSSASERSFVTKMKEKYAEEKERNSGKEQVRTPLPELPRSNSSVSQIAQRYSVDLTSNSPPVIPIMRHRHSNSMQQNEGNGESNAILHPPYLSTAASNRVSFSDLPPSPSRNTASPTSISQNNLMDRTNVPSSDFSRDEGHSRFCGCESCSRSNYGESGRSTQREEEKVQSGLRSEGRSFFGRKRF